MHDYIAIFVSFIDRKTVETFIVDMNYLPKEERQNMLLTQLANLAMMKVCREKGYSKGIVNSCMHYGDIEII